MKLKKIVSLLACVSLLALGFFTSCDNPSGSDDGTGDGKKIEDQNGNQSGNGVDGKGEVTSTESGIKLTWGNLPEGTKHLRIQTMIGSEQYDLFEINDLSKYSYVIDENVTKGKSYQYRFVYLDEKYNWFNSSNWQTIKAESGKGERVITATPTSSGIKLSGDISEVYYAIELERYHNDQFSRFYFYDNAFDTDGSFTDEYVDSGKEYEYRLILTVGAPRHWKNGQEIPADPLVKYPRFKPVKVTATGGSGSIKTSTLPEAEYNSENKTITLKQGPEFSVTPRNWWMSFNYGKTNYGSYNFAEFASGNNGVNEVVIKDYIPDGYWRFKECYFSLYFDKFTYSYSEYELPDVPEEIFLNVKKEDLFFPTLNATADGIEISWDKSKLPADTERLYIQSTGHWFDISDLSITSVLDKYVESGKTYEYYIRACNKNGNELLRSESVKEKATGGKGKLKIENENKITVSYDERAGAVAFSELPMITGNPSKWNVNFEYNNSRYLFSINSTDKNLITNLYDAPAGDWTFTSYYINDYSNPAYRYCQWDDNLEAFSNFPETITISDAYKPKLTATAVEDGIKLQWENLPDQTKRIQIQANNKFIDIYDLTLTSFVDNYVEPGKTYEYYIRVYNESGNTSVQSESVSVKATGGKGKFRIENKIAITYDEVEGEVTFSELPKLTDNPAEWSMNFNYQQNKNKNENWTLFGLYSGNNKLTRSLNNAPNGEWIFNGYWINNDSNSSYRYCQWEDNLDVFTKFPEKITISDTYKPKLTATNVENGIKFQWENIPENPQYLAIRIEAKDDSSFIEYRINNKELINFVAENVTAGKTYDCYLNIRKSNENWISSNHVEFTPANGKGEVLITNSPAAVLEGTDKVSFTTVPQVSGLSLGTNWTAEFRYTLGNNGDYGLYKYHSNPGNTISSISSWVENGNWTLDEYCVWFDTEQDDFEYFNYVYDISKLNGMPKQIVINKEN